MVHEGRHEAIITEEVWESAQAKKKANGGRKEPIDKDHQYSGRLWAFRESWRAN